MKNGKLLFVAIYAILLSGCQPVNPNSLVGQSQTTKKEEWTDFTTYKLTSFQAAREFRLQDGTRCVIITDGGITCEWTK